MTIGPIVDRSDPLSGAGYFRELLVLPLGENLQDPLLTGLGGRSGGNHEVEEKLPAGALGFEILSGGGWSSEWRRGYGAGGVAGQATPGTGGRVPFKGWNANK